MEKWLITAPISSPGLLSAPHIGRRSAVDFLATKNNQFFEWSESKLVGLYTKKSLLQIRGNIISLGICKLFYSVVCIYFKTPPNKFILKFFQTVNFFIGTHSCRTQRSVLYHGVLKRAFFTTPQFFSPR